MFVLFSLFILFFISVSGIIIHFKLALFTVLFLMFNLHYNYCPRSYKNLLMTFCAKYWWGTKLKVIFQLFGKINAVCQINKVGNNDSWKLVQAFYGHELVRKICCTLILYKFLCLWICPEDNYAEHWFWISFLWSWISLEAMLYQFV